MNKIYFFLFLLFASAQSFSQTLTVAADKDNTIYSAYPGNSNGSGAFLFAGQNGASNANSVQRALLHFNLSSIPAGSTITAATLTITVGKSGPVATGINLNKLTTDWGAGTSDAGGVEASGAAATTNDATWVNNFFGSSTWTTAGGDFSGTASGHALIGSSITSNTVINISSPGILADIQSFVNNPATNFGWIISSDNEAQENSVKRIISTNSANASLRPTLSVTYTAGAVPVTLKSFSASLKNKDALLHWTTATEINNNYFDIEHSMDGNTFSSVGRVNGNGTSVVEHAYDFTHSNIGAGKHYYRLAQHDKDGAVKYSQVVLLLMNSRGQLQVKPNPATSFITVTASSALEGATFIIHSTAGQVVKRGVLNNKQIDVQQLPSGQYWLSVEGIGTDALKASFIKK